MFNQIVSYKRWRRVLENPVSFVKFAKERNARIRYLEYGEIQKLLAASTDHLHSIVLTALHRDMRRGEILNLLWTDIDFKNERSTSENRRTAKGGLFRSAPNFEKLYSPCRRGLKTASSSPAIFHGVRERTPTLSASSSLLSI